MPTTLRTLTQKIRLFIRSANATDESLFNDLALELFHFHYHHNPGYRRYCRQLNQTSTTFTHWQQIPAIPQTAFKQSKTWLTVFPKQDAKNYFETSGTTSARKGKHYFKDLALYHLASATSFRFTFQNHLDLKKKILFLFLKESPQEAKHSSLSYMFQNWKRTFGTPTSRFLISHNHLDIVTLTKIVKSSQTPIFLAGTAFAFASLFEKNLKLSLPKGSVIMETGGFKGKTREINKKDFYHALRKQFQVPDKAIYNEYGMTELFSQAYACGAKGHHQFPPWMRFRILDPDTQQLARAGNPGIIELLDLANVQSCFAIQTQDLGIQQGNKLELLGRTAPETRGCSLTAENLLT
jgi:diadenosine tetraphosphate (Ap4A) HIT family hydrolase